MRTKRYNGSWIRVGLAKRDWSARELSEATGLNVWSIYSWMRGQNVPPSEAVKKLRAALRSKIK